MEHLILFFVLLLFMCLDLENTNVENHWRQMTKENTSNHTTVKRYKYGADIVGNSNENIGTTFVEYGVLDGPSSSV